MALAQGSARGTGQDRREKDHTAQEHPGSHGGLKSPLLNTARQLAIRLNTTMCVTIDSTGMQYHKDTCGAAAYVVTGTDASGYLQLPSGLTLSGTSNICFGYLGGPPPPPIPVGCNMSGTITVTRSSGGSMNVIIASPGRVRLQ